MFGCKSGFPTPITAVVWNSLTMPNIKDNLLSALTLPRYLFLYREGSRSILSRQWRVLFVTELPRLSATVVRMQIFVLFSVLRVCIDNSMPHIPRVHHNWKKNKKKENVTAKWQLGSQLSPAQTSCFDILMQRIWCVVMELEYQWSLSVRVKKAYFTVSYWQTFKYYGLWSASDYKCYKTVT